MSDPLSSNERDIQARLVTRLLEWAHGRYAAEVQERPESNIYKRKLAETWDQVIRKLESELPP